MRITLSFLRILNGSNLWRSIGAACLVAGSVLAIERELAAQPANNALVAPAAAPGNGILFGGPNANNPQGNNGQGGAQNADFESLIELITSTISAEMWADNGGTGDVRPFPGGVLVDSAGTLRLKSRQSATDDLTFARGEAPKSRVSRKADDARRASSLRYVSLPRLEREIARRRAAREPLDAAMLTLAGLQRVRYVFVYPESGDLVLAGPAGDWQVDADGRILSSDTGEAVVRLDDLLVLLRRGTGAAESYFGCSINPRQEALAKTQAFLASSNQKPLQPGQRKKWLGELRDSVGTQDIEVFGIDPASRAAGVLIEADYHMKLIGMGLADGVDGVASYLDLVKRATERAGARALSAADGRPPDMSVLRWWFALDYDSIRTSRANDAFELTGQGARVLSENELLAEQGRRVHTGQSDALNRQFADDFTAHFAELADKYPVYRELRNIFDLAIAVALIQTNELAEKANWEPGILADVSQLRLPQLPVPRQVETVVNHRVINRVHIVAGVSGGVMVAPGDVLDQGWAVDDSGELAQIHRNAPASDAAAGAWWWDVDE